MPTIAEVRQKYPQYKDMSDDQLATALHKKFYSDMPENEFRQKIGLATQVSPHAPGFSPKRPLTWDEKVKQTGEAFEKSAGEGLAGLGRTALAAGENVASIASGVVGDTLGAVASAKTQDPKLGENIRRMLTYQPHTQAGQTGQEHIAALTSPVTDILNKPVEALEKRGHPVAAQAARGIMDVAPIKVPKALRAGLRTAGEVVRPVAEKIAATGEARAAVRAAEEAPKQTKIQQARTLGLKLPPSEAGGAVGKTLEGVGGKVQTEMSLSRANSKVINRAAAKEIGLSERQRMTPANIERLKQKHFATYDRVKKAGRIDADDAFRQELEKVRERTKQAEADYPEDTNELIDKEIRKFDRPSADSSSMLEKIKSLRDRASRNMQSPDAEKFELGLAQKKIATAMENLIERQVAARDPSLISDFRKAREQLAKIYNVQDALSPNGNVSAAVLARQLKRNVPLSGNLRTIAETYQEFPKVMRYVDSLGGHAPFSALDYLVGGVEAAANPASAAKVVGALAGRPIARGIIGSEAYQRAGIKPREVKPSVASRAARKIAGPKKNEVGDLEPASRRRPATVQDLPP